MHFRTSLAAAQHPEGLAQRKRLKFANAGTVTVIAMFTNPESGGSSYFLN